MTMSQEDDDSDDGKCKKDAVAARKPAKNVVIEDPSMTLDNRLTQVRGLLHEWKVALDEYEKGKICENAIEVKHSHSMQRKRIKSKLAQLGMIYRLQREFPVTNQTEAEPNLVDHTAVSLVKKPGTCQTELADRQDQDSWR